MADLKQTWAEYNATGERSVRSRLILDCMPLVRYVVASVVPCLPACLDREDLVGSGVFGLIDAIERYDASRQTKFESYAILRIRGAVLDELRAHDFNPRTVRNRVRQAEELRKRLQEKYRGTPAEEHLEQALRSENDDIDETARMISFVSLNDTETETAPGETRVIDELVDTRTPSAVDQAMLNEARETLILAVEELSDYEREVIQMYYYRGMMLKDIGRLYKVTESRISQVHTRALNRLRSRMKHLK